MKKFIFIFTLLIVSHFYSSAQVSLRGVVIPSSLSKDSVTLILNGAGVRNKYFIDVYVAGLYLQTKNNKEKSIIEADKPMAVRLHIISKAVTMERMAEAIREGFDRSLMGRTAKFQSQIDNIVEIFMAEPVNVDDIFDIWYTPNLGVTAFKNGKDLNVLIKGLAFKKAMMGIWLCPNPVDENLKIGMLGY